MADRKQQLAPSASESAEITRCLATSPISLRWTTTMTTSRAGKWNHIRPGLVTGKNLASWNSQVRWPWGERDNAATTQPTPPLDRPLRAMPLPQTAAHPSQTPPGRRSKASATSAPRWSPSSCFDLRSALAFGDPKAPSLEYDFTEKSNSAATPPDALITFLPTFRIAPSGMKTPWRRHRDRQPSRQRSTKFPALPARRMNVVPCAAMPSSRTPSLSMCLSRT